MELITATRDTWLKREPAQSGTLSKEQKMLCQSGAQFEVDKYKAVAGGHWQVTIDGDDWFIYDDATHGSASHWDCSWEKDDAKEKEQFELPPTQASFSVPVQDEPTKIIVGPDLKPGDDFSTYITENITYGEWCKYSEERRFDYKDQCETAYKLSLFLEDVRHHFGGHPLRITSGYRPGPVNRSVGGATYSEHLFRAPGIGGVDFYIEGVSTYDVEGYCDRNWSGSVGYGAARGFVHLGCGRGRVRWPY